MVVTRTLIAVLLATSVAGAANAQTLAPGKPGGVKAAQLDVNTLVVTASGLTLIAGFAVLVSGQKLDATSVVLSGGSNVLGVQGVNSPGSFAITSTR